MDRRTVGRTANVSWRIRFWLIFRLFDAYLLICRLAAAFLFVIGSSFVRYLLFIALLGTEIGVTIRVLDCGFGLDSKMLFGFYTDFVFYTLSGCCLDFVWILVGCW
jgi:hypothetical protein